MRTRHRFGLLSVSQSTIVDEGNGPWLSVCLGVCVSLSLSACVSVLILKVPLSLNYEQTVHSSSTFNRDSGQPMALSLSGLLDRHSFTLGSDRDKRMNPQQIDDLNKFLSSTVFRCSSLQLFKSPTFYY